MQPGRFSLLVLLLLSFGLFGGCGEDDATQAADGGVPSGPSSTATTATASPSASATVAPSSSSADAAGGAGGAPDTAATASGTAPAPLASAAPKGTGKAPTPPSSSEPPPLPATSATATTPPPPVTVAVEAAKAGSADEVAAKLDAIFGPIQRFKADFKQEYRAKIHGSTKKSTGVLWVQKPGKISLKYADPNKNRAVSDGLVLKVFEHENKQMFLKDVKNTEYPGAFAFILGKGLRSSFTFEFNDKTKWEGGPVIVGTPRVPNPGYKKVLFYIDAELLKHGDLGAVRRVLVIDAQGNRNQFDFIQAVEPDSIPAGEFLFEPPAGTETIKG